MNVGGDMAKLVPGRVSTEVDARLAYNTHGIIRKVCKRLYILHKCICTSISVLKSKNYLGDIYKSKFWFPYFLNSIEFFESIMLMAIVSVMVMWSITKFKRKVLFFEQKLCKNEFLNSWWLLGFLRWWNKSHSFFYFWISTQNHGISTSITAIVWCHAVI